MKATATTLVAFMLLASSVFACDEACEKKKAQKENKVEFPNYVSWQFCEETRLEFMTKTMKSLEKYSTKHFDTRYKGGMRNIKNFLLQRKEWLNECDKYMHLTGKGHIFDDKKTTKAIFASMKNVDKELGALISGVTYSGSESTDIMREKFDDLFTKVDNHKNLMHLKGKIVYR